ncbi:MAG TPA: class I SAM-dependent methyltransferase [Thermodesulfovibrionales bacterium]|nr:class I SAM-dependent methyltransferase [Thermodesulfovibrionales bacterium]
MNVSGQDYPLDQELQWWIKTWNPTLKSGRFWNADTPALLDLDSELDISYEERRWLEARAQVIRTLAEAQIADLAFFIGKIVVEIGPGPVGFLDACGARIAIGIDPLANAFRQQGLMLPNSDVVYLNTVAESIPLVDEFVDIIVSRNSLDHVTEPEKVLDETWRVLKPGGFFLLNVDIEHEQRPLEPHCFSLAKVDHLLSRFRIDRKILHSKSHGGSGRMYVALCVKPARQDIAG